MRIVLGSASMACRIGSIVVFAAWLTGCVEVARILGPESGSTPVFYYSSPEESDSADQNQNDDAGDNTNDNDAEDESPIFGGIGDIPLLEEGEPITTDSGLTYIDIEVGQGPQPEPAARVTVNYVGWLTDGTEFDSGDSVQFGLNGVIDGWTEGVGSMQVGGRRRLLIPPELGYGETGSPPTIPPDATLIFDIELLDFENGS